MRRIHTLSAAALVVGGLVIGGCKPSEPAPTPMTPTAMTPAQPEVPMPATTPPAAKDLTHVLAVDQPFYLSEPGAAPKPAGTLMAGSKVLVLIPGAMYSQVLTDKGISAFTLTAGLNPLGK
jgi:hypothetical protein